MRLPKGTTKLLFLGALLIIALVFLLPNMPEFNQGTTVKLGDATLYDAQGKVVGTVKAGGIIPGAFVTPEGTGGAVKCVIPVDYEVWLYDYDETPTNPYLKVHLIRTTTAGSFVGPGETVENTVTVVGTWIYEGTSRKAGGKDWRYTGQTSFDLDADAIQSDYDLAPGAKISFAGYIEVTSSGLSAKQRSTNEVTLQIAEDYNGQLVIEKLSVS